MSALASMFGLSIDSPLVASARANFRPSTWPPTPEFPVVIDENGNVVSRYGDAVWDLSLWSGKPTVINFGDGIQRAGIGNISSVNADFLRQIAGWLLWGPRSVRNAASLQSSIKFLRILFLLCSKKGVRVDKVSRFPAIVDELSTVAPPSHARALLTLLHTLFAQRDSLGFVLLDRESLRRFESSLPEHLVRQTPYIPPRIWTYQLSRLRIFLEEFMEHEAKLRSCYEYCLEKYSARYGTLTAATEIGRHKRKGPFTKSKFRSEHSEAFRQTAERFGILQLLQRWCTDDTSGANSWRISAFSKYFTMASRVGIAYLLNLSLMRINEAWSLRSDCLYIESDPAIGPVYLLQGKTTKFIEDDDARWVTSPHAALAVNVLRCVAMLRMICGQANPAVPNSPEEVKNPYLVVRPYEPWARAKNITLPTSIRSGYPCYQGVMNDHPKLFDVDELRIRDEDIEIARRITPNLDARIFAVGNIWPLSWHQLRRTGTVNMQASGIVSDESIQYQLKHATRAMSVYYGQGYSRLRLNNSVRTEYIRTMYELLSKEIAKLSSDRYVSPYGENRKNEILKIVNQRDHRKLLAAAKTGRVAWRETLLGGCTRRGPCEYGGIDNIVRCGGGDGAPPCADALFDKERVGKLIYLKRELAERLEDAPVGSPYKTSLEAQQRALENAIAIVTERKRC
ncbi:Phage integrase family site specific recombinase [Cupriavidus taiwanensis]|uniref:hypothetical protein n=1 Tax=Cupriavidus taiwanensis TaxID=164546 RepID=UPI000E188A70|nr:hypothetical protein [Cupriavidus taiwanensis]SOY54119.1 Phage integrase family site specific recombinase [Cupriavidus taiwanensis]